MSGGCHEGRWCFIAIVRRCISTWQATRTISRRAVACVWPAGHFDVSGLLVRMSRTVLSTLGMLSLVCFAGCASHETYGDRALPETERAVIEGYSRYQLLYFEELQIVSVDGRRERGQTGWPYASSVSVPSGRHWVQLLILRNSSDIAMCAFEWNFEAKHHYQLERVNHEQLLLAHASAPRFPASISMVATSASEPPRRISTRAECGKAASCHRDEDCPAHSTCEEQAGFEFGSCNSRDR